MSTEDIFCAKWNPLRLFSVLFERQHLYLFIWKKDFLKLSLFPFTCYFNSLWFSNLVLKQGGHDLIFVFVSFYSITFLCIKVDVLIGVYLLFRSLNVIPSVSEKNDPSLNTSESPTSLKSILFITLTQSVIYNLICSSCFY